MNSLDSSLLRPTDVCRVVKKLYGCKIHSARHNPSKAGFERASCEPFDLINTDCDRKFTSAEFNAGLDILDADHNGYITETESV